MTDIACTPASKAQVDRTVSRVTLTATAGDTIRCTVTNQRAATINARQFQDANGDKQRQLEEPWLAGGTMLVYDSYGSAPVTGVTDLAGKATFTSLHPGTYTVCVGNQPGWDNSLPGLMHPAYNQPCYALIVRPKQTATITFGNRPAAVAASVATAATPIIDTPDASGITITNDADVAADEAGYDGHAIPADAEAKPVLAQSVFLPIIQRSK